MMVLDYADSGSADPTLCSGFLVDMAVPPVKTVILLLTGDKGISLDGMHEQHSISLLSFPFLGRSV